MTSKNSKDGTESQYHYRVCCWCGNDRVDDPQITWAIKSKTKRIGLCTACEREVPLEWIKLTDDTDDCSKIKND
jgi:hypothetical protein